MTFYPILNLNYLFDNQLNQSNSIFKYALLFTKIFQINFFYFLLIFNMIRIDKKSNTFKYENQLGKLIKSILNKI